MKFPGKAIPLRSIFCYYIDREQVKRFAEAVFFESNLSFVMIETMQENAGVERPGQELPWANPFFTLWISQAISLFGSQLVSFVLIWHLTQTTGSAEVLSMAALLNLLPQILLGPLAGILIDRWNLRRILIAMQVLMILAILILVLLFSFSRGTVLLIDLMIFFMGVSSGCNNPALVVATTFMVPNRHLTRIQGLNQTLQGGLYIFSAPLGALLLSKLSLQTIFTIALLAPLVAVMCLFFIKIHQELKDAQTIGMVIGDLYAGLRYIAGWPGLLMVTGIAVITNFLDSPALALTPLLVTKHFNGGAFQLGWINATFGIGVILGGLLLSAWGGFRRRMVTCMLGLIGLGLGAWMVGVAPSSAFWLAVAGFFIGGFMQTLANASIVAALQATVEPAFQGRVIAFVFSLTSAAAPIGLLVAGPLGERYGVPIWFVTLAFACIILGIAGLLTPSIANLDSRSHPTVAGAV